MIATDTPANSLPLRAMPNTNSGKLNDYLGPIGRFEPAHNTKMRESWPEPATGKTVPATGMTVLGTGMTVPALERDQTVINRFISVTAA